MPAHSISDAVNRKLALSVAVLDSSQTVYTLYDAGRFREYITKLPVEKLKNLEENDQLQSTVIAMIAVISPDDGTQYGIPEVAGSAAEKGYGPLLYDIVMSIEGGITSDRGSVSSSAKKLWSYYKNNRPDVKAKPLDDKEKPKTPEKFDDSHIHAGGEESPLNYVYIPSKTPNADALISNHKAIEKMLQTNGIEIDFSEFGISYFHSRYHTE